MSGRTNSAKKIRGHIKNRKCKKKRFFVEIKSEKHVGKCPQVFPFYERGIEALSWLRYRLSVADALASAPSVVTSDSKLPLPLLPPVPPSLSLPRLLSSPVTASYHRHFYHHSHTIAASVSNAINDSKFSLLPVPPPQLLPLPLLPPVTASFHRHLYRLR